jgi:tetratricopeptide (TPR) repeat protein
MMMNSNTRLPLAILSKSDDNKSPEHAANSIPPPKAAPPKPNRPRSGSAGPVLASPSPVPNTAQLEQPYALQRSSSNSKAKSLMRPSTHDKHRRTRSYSSSSVASYVSVTSSSNSESSMTSLLSSLEVRRHKYGETHTKVGSAWSRIGSYFFQSRNFPQALEAFKHAVVCFPVGEPALAASYSNIGTVYWASGQPEQAITFLEKALEIYELIELSEGRDPEESLEVANTLYQMGLCNTLRGLSCEALANLKKCQKIQASQLSSRDIQVGRTLDAIGKVHYFKEEYSTALQCHEEARRIKSASGENDNAVITSILNVAAVHHATKNWNAALSNYTKVMYLQKSELVRCRNQKGQPLVSRAAQEVGETLQLMGNLHSQMGEEAKAQRFYKEATLLFEEAGIPEDDPRFAALKQLH